MKNIKLLHGDCLELLKTIPDKSIDLILTDPPFGMTACKWDSVIPFEPMWKELKRIRKDNTAIVLFGSEPFSSHLRMSNLKEFKYDWIWKKSNPSNIAMAKKRPLLYHEIASIFYSQMPSYYPQMIERKSERISQAHKTNYSFVSTSSSDVNFQTDYSDKPISSHNYDAKKKLPSSILEIASLRANSKEWCKHPTQKPVALLEYLIKTYTLEGETVLDFTMGSGSTGVAAKNLGRSFIGIEKDLTYYDIATKRIYETLVVKG